MKAGLMGASSCGGELTLLSVTQDWAGSFEVPRVEGVAPF